MKSRATALAMGFIAVASFSEAARCQTSVTLYGIADASLSSISFKDSTGKTHVTRGDSGTGYGSRLGFRVVEDLGDGLKANVLLEQGVALDTGTLQQGGAAFGRQAFVGLSGKQWSVSLGRQYSPINSLVAAADAFGQMYWGNSQGTGIGQHSAKATPADGGFQAPARVNNSVLLSGNVDAWSARLMLSAGDEKQSAGRSVGASLGYQGGPLFLSAAFHREKQFATDIPTGSDPAGQSTWALGGAYDFNFAKLFAGYYRFTPSRANTVLTSASTLRHTSGWVGVRVPVFTTGTIIGQVMSSRYQHPDGVPGGKALTMGLTYEHALSKRTALYTSWGRINNNATSTNWLWASTVLAAPARAGGDISALSVGMWHRF